jgi:hypothetical protein
VDGHVVDLSGPVLVHSHYGAEPVRVSHEEGPEPAGHKRNTKTKPQGERDQTELFPNASSTTHEAAGDLAWEASRPPALPPRMKLRTNLEYMHLLGQSRSFGSCPTGMFQHPAALNHGDSAMGFFRLLERLIWKWEALVTSSPIFCLYLIDIISKIV